LPRECRHRWERLARGWPLATPALLPMSPIWTCCARSARSLPLWPILCPSYPSCEWQEPLTQQSSKIGSQTKDLSLSTTSARSCRTCSASVFASSFRPGAEVFAAGILSRPGAAVFAAGIDITVTHCWFARCAPRTSAWNMQFPSPGTGSRRKPLGGTYSFPMHVRSRRAQDAREAVRTDLRGAVSRSPAPTQRSPDEKACRATSHEGCHFPKKKTSPGVDAGGASRLLTLDGLGLRRR
jgi:hypothetical protein